MNFSHNGLLLYNKAPGLTSFQSLDIIKKKLNTKKAGHTGTLDKFASGLLLVLLGKSLKLAPLFLEHNKEYVAEIFFGKETDTLDPEGKEIASSPVPDEDTLRRSLEVFKGDIMQAPPLYSAIHINGKRAYKLARSGEKPEMKERPAHIYNLELLSWKPPIACIKTLVSSGTYIRSLARDIAIEAGSRAHLSSLTRTRVGPFSLSDAFSTDVPETEPEPDMEDFSSHIRKFDPALFGELGIPVLFIDDVKSFLQGKPLDRILSPDYRKIFINDPGVNKTGRMAAVFNTNINANTNDESDSLLGYIVRQEGKWKYGHVYVGN